MFKRNGKIKENINKRVDTFIGKDTSMSGSIEAKGIVHVEGYFEGEITTEDEVIIGAGAKAKANVKSGSVTLAGIIEGNVEAFNRLLIRSGGELLGDISTGVLAVEDGAVFKGNCDMKGGETKNFPGIKPQEALPGEESLQEDDNKQESAHQKESNGNHTKKKKKNRSKK